ncbi:glycosyltransferase family 1 protein [Bacillus sp. NTK071]|uniref:glycosyltransferase n=1 Tax=Bacillus sp. NTK071 TaxID=2802175 RepID=UPI001A8D5324|nr:glycosyltransferase [Bacillus sp. NTK071]MBN8207254.1 glycosyltransferase family 1 protein [Bacillus sp. NTK071]
MMARVKLLFITKDHTFHIEKSSVYLIEELKKLTDLTVWSMDGNINEIVSQIGERPDFILLNDYKPDYCPEITGLQEVGIPYGLIMHDLQYKMHQRRRFIKRENVQHIFVNYRTAFEKWYPAYINRMIWFPHHVPRSIYKNHHLSRDNNYVMIGAIYKELYPLRVAILNKYHNHPDFTYFPHPGYHAMDHSKRGYKVGVDYSKELNNAKIFFTCDSNYHFPLLKYFEVLACGTLLLASGSEELRELGFIDGKTYVEINQSNFAEKAKYYLDNEEERITIAKRGEELIRERHSTEIRAQELIAHITKIIS